MLTIKPFVKWAGGKTQLIPHLTKKIPQNYGSYFEPFIGGGALLFALQPSTSIINDINKELIHTYLQIQSNVEEVIFWLKKLDDNHVGDIKSYYYDKRDEYNKAIINQQYTTYMAALFIYINKHCFNGLYRVNSKGLFNVPFNQKKTGNSFDEANLRNLSLFLSKVSILNQDFEECCANAKKGDFVFFDSPYAPLNDTSFESYTKEGFSFDEHVRLANLFKSLTNQGVYCMLTNHNTELINTLYNDFNIDVVSVKRMINSDATNRTGEEVIITNY